LAFSGHCDSARGFFSQLFTTDTTLSPSALTMVLIEPLRDLLALLIEAAVKAESGVASNAFGMGFVVPRLGVNVATRTELMVESLVARVLFLASSFFAGPDVLAVGGPCVDGETTE
jgi:hypothetical protein